MSGIGIARRGTLSTSRGAVTPVAFQTAPAGSGTNLGFNPSISRTISTTATAATGLCGVALMMLYANNGNHGTVFANWGASAMTQLLFHINATRALAIFGLLSPPTGAQNVQMGMTTASSNTGRSISAFTGVYTNVGSFGTAAGVVSASQVVTSAVGEMIVNVGGRASSITSYSQTLRGGSPISPGGSPDVRGLYGDAVGAASVTFSVDGVLDIMGALQLLPA